MGNDFLFIFLGIIALYYGYQNIKLIRYNKHYRGFAECARAIFDRAEDAEEKVDKYIENEKDPSFINKALIFKLYEQLNKNEEYSEVLTQIDLTALYINNKNIVDSKVAIANADGFIWSVALLNKAYALNNFDFIKTYLAKFAVNDAELNKIMEYALLKESGKYFLSQEDKGIPFFTSLVQGTYDGFVYEKRLVGTYKRIAALYLSLAGEELGDYEREDLAVFADTSIGKLMTTDLAVYEKYHKEKEEDPKEDEDLAVKDENAENISEDETDDKDSDNSEIIDKEAKD